MENKNPSPSDLMPDEASYAIINGVKVRKGSAAAVFANAKILSSESATAAQKEKAHQIITELAPALVAAGIYEVVTWKNPEIQKIFEQAAKTVK